MPVREREEVQAVLRGIGIDKGKGERVSGVSWVVGRREVGLGVTDH